ncbi:MAG: 5-oxoprolinase subunit PxpB [Paraglaciecola sp.]|uniref:5-oxoprolinase subunit PxpB n=1 Tax=Paraglaciecola sp. TaxID=1920173 RepID=UPI00329897D3
MQQVVHYPQIEIAGEGAVIIYLDKVASNTTIKKISQLKHSIARVLADSVVELVPSYASLLVIFDPIKTDYYAVKKVLSALLEEDTSEIESTHKTIELPVYYSLESGPDLQSLANRSGLSVEDVIEIHQKTIYHVYAIGFAPGFAFLGEVDKRIACPRLASPRAKVAKGSVGIADRQTAIYPNVSPGGWNLIGLCPQTLFDPNVAPYLTYQVGDSVKFDAITRDEFLALGGKL